jgi:hypothetical protein
MRFLMLVCSDPDADPYRAEEDDIDGWFDAVSTSGAYLDGDRLRPAEETRTVRMRNGRLSVEEAPAEQASAPVVGFDLLQCADWDEALEIAARHPMARFGRIELRALSPLD